jgi:carboxypeptidase C (cathepsin A)
MSLLRNKFANVLFIEAPAGVGFSYADDPVTDYNHTDTSTAQDNLAAVQVGTFLELSTSKQCMQV